MNCYSILSNSRISQICSEQNFSENGEVWFILNPLKLRKSVLHCTCLSLLNPNIGDLFRDLKLVMDKLQSLPIYFGK